MRLRERQLAPLNVQYEEQRSKAVGKMKKYRSKIYENRNKHRELKEKDRIRKRNERLAKSMSETYSETIKRREYEKLRKREQRRRKKENEKEKTPNDWRQEIRKKQMLSANRVRRQIANSESTPKTPAKSQSNHGNDLKISKAIFKSLTPRSKRKCKFELNNTMSPSKKIMLKSSGLNLFNPISSGSANENGGLSSKVKEFFDRDDVSRVCPDTRKSVIVEGEKVQLRYRLGYLKTLYNKFISETNEDCCYETFTKHVPPYVKKPSASEWGTCLCVTCLNPELKVEKLKHLKMLPSDTVLENSMNDYDFGLLLEKIESLTKKDGDVSVTYNEWRRVDHKNKKGKISKISRKEVVTSPLKKMVKVLIAELNSLKSHLHRAHMQYKAFKMKRTESAASDDIFTMQIDWSENSKVRQAREEKSAYYHQDQISIHAMRVWVAGEQFSHAALSDVSDHKAAPVFASIEPILIQYLESYPIKEINIVSDSPTSQYRNKKIFYLIGEFCKQHRVDFNWIYLEAGHGKGTPDGIGAAVKRAIADSVSLNPDEAWISTSDFMKVLPKMLPSIKLSVYGEEEIKSKVIPGLKGILGTGKCHQVSATFEDGELTMSMKELSNLPAKKFALVVTSSSVPEGEDDSDEEDEHVEKPDQTLPLALPTSTNHVLVTDDHVGKFFAVFYFEKMYWGRLTKVFYHDVDSTSAAKAEFNFLHYQCGYWDFPKKEDKDIAEIRYVLHGPCTPKSTTRSGYQFDEDDLVNQKYKDMKNLIKNN